MGGGSTDTPKERIWWGGVTTAEHPLRPYFSISYLFPSGVQGGLTPLVGACKQGSLELVKALVALGADINPRDNVSLGGGAGGLGSHSKEMEGWECGDQGAEVCECVGYFYRWPSAEMCGNCVVKLGSVKAQ